MYHGKIIRRIASLLILGAVLASVGCSIAPRLTLATGAPGFNQTRFMALVAETSKTRRNIHSLIIERQGQIVVELYRNGSNTYLSNGGGLFNLWSTIGPETLHDVRSSTKSVLALLAGTVLARHPEYSIHSRIVDFPELAAKVPKWAQDLELRHFMNMSSGFSWKEWGQSMITSDETRLIWKRDPVRYSLDRPVTSLPGIVFNYSGGSTFIVSRMLELIDGRSIAEIAKSDLFEPLGITDWRWGKGWNGYYLPNAGIGLRSRDMLKIGELMLAHGSWQGRQVIPAAWVDEVTAPLIRVQTTAFDLDEQGTSYGYFWWNGTVDIQGQRTRWYSTVGNGGQKIFVVPSLELIVIMTGGEYGSLRMQIWETGLLREIIASVVSE